MYNRSAKAQAFYLKSHKTFFLARVSMHYGFSFCRLNSFHGFNLMFPYNYMSICEFKSHKKIEGKKFSMLDLLIT